MRAIGVNVGGTFTDLALWDDARGALVVFKLPRSRKIPSSALCELQAATRRRSWDQSGTDWVIDSKLLLVGQRTHPSFVLAPIGHQ